MFVVSCLASGWSESSIAMQESVWIAFRFSWSFCLALNAELSVGWDVLLWFRFPPALWVIYSRPKILQSHLLNDVRRAQTKKRPAALSVVLPLDYVDSLKYAALAPSRGHKEFEDRRSNCTSSFTVVVSWPSGKTDIELVNHEPKNSWYLQ